MWRVVKHLILITCVTVFPTAVFAQGAGATIAGVVKDTSGAVLPGVTVQAASPTLIERVRETVTDGTGQYRIVDLRPGAYTVTATLTGFSTFRREGIEASGTGTITVNAEMKVGSIEETVTVSGETPVVDLQSTTRERVMSKEVVDSLPTSRLYYSLGVLVPGVNMSGFGASRDVGGSLGDVMASLATHGGRPGDQRVLQNGLNVMTLVTGGGDVGGSVPNMNATQEVAIDTSAASAERQTGGVSMNFIPRDGGNILRGSIFATGASEGQQASNFSQDLRDQGLTQVNKYKKNWDINPGIGGPILQDKLWYYYTYRNNGAHNYQAGMFSNQNEFLPNVWTYSPNLGRPALARHGLWTDNQIRLTWQANAKNKFAGTWDQQYQCRCPETLAGLTASTAPESANDMRFPVQRLLHAEWWSPVTSKVLVELVALHRTERWGFMSLTSKDDGGSLTSAAQAAIYPSMIGVTQQQGPIPNLVFHGPSGTKSNIWTANYTYRWAVSYITGAHAFKVGGQDSIGFVTTTTYIPTLDPGSPSQGMIQRPVRYTFSTDNNPIQVTAFHTPYTVKNDLSHDFGLFAQDRWTLDRLTLNLGVRYDSFASEIPAQFLTPSTMGRPETAFPKIERAVDWKDVTPRFGASYDLQGDGKTAVKVSLNKYIAGQGLGGLPSTANPIGRLTHNVTRNWTDTNGNFIVDCNLNTSKTNGECTNNASAAFGSVVVPGATPDNPAGLTDFNVRRGWGVRSYNWEFSAGVQREIMPRVSVDISYFRRWFGNFTATDNVAVAPTDFRYFDITTPRDSRLPGGGGQTITGFTDFASVAAATVPPNNQVVFADDIGANQIDHWNGVDVSVNARLQNGLLLQGGTSTGRRSTNNCGVSAALPETLGTSPQSFCGVTEPFLTQLKLVGAYTLPRYSALPATLGQILQNIQVAATFQSLPGDQVAATYSMSSSNTDPRGNEIATPALSTLGGPLMNNATSKTVSLVKPGTEYWERSNQLDLRIGRILRFGRTRTTVNFDIFNVLNENTVLGRNNALSRNMGGTFAVPTDTTNAVNSFGIPLVNGANNQVRQGTIINGINASNTLWTPTSILQARFFKISATFDF